MGEAGRLRSIAVGRNASSCALETPAQPRDPGASSRTLKRFFHQNRTVSWQISMRRSNGISSTCHRESGLRMRIITARRIISGELLKQRYGL